MTTTAEMLAEAQAARHSLLTGAKIAKVTTADGESVDYAPVDVAKLDSYIAMLQALLAGSTSATRRARAVKVFY